MNDQTKFHIALHVSDVDSTVAFYTDLFEREPVKVKPDYAKFELENPGLVISFIQLPGKVNPHFGHLGLRVHTSEELAHRKATIQSKLKITLEEENVSCCYAIQDKFWVSDPDGYEWEVYHKKEDVENRDKNYSAVSCC